MSDEATNSADPIEAPICQVCGSPITDGPAVYCADCGTAHHRDCWTYNRSCSTYGCHGVAFSETPPVQSTAAVVVDENTPMPEAYASAAVMKADAGPITWLSHLGRPPYGGDSFFSPLPPAKIAARLQEHVEAAKPPGWLSSTEGKDFTGTVSEDGFEIVPQIRYRNSFVPLIHGRFVPTLEGTQVKISQRPNGFIIAFMALWMGIVTTVFVGGIVAALSGAGGLVALPFCLLPFGMMVFGWLMVSGGFWYEALPARKKLRKLLEAKVQDKA